MKPTIYVPSRALIRLNVKTIKLNVHFSNHIKEHIFVKKEIINAKNNVK